ncbi:sulfatase [Planctomycetota bacterium]|nr:sulfatase [Planctomycetota bacterium]
MRIKHLTTPLLVSSLTLLPHSLSAAPPTQTQNSDKPNIIFILADDMGYMDPAYNGHPFFETPNIDKLASDGMIFTDAYSCGPNSAPTRASFITGTYTPRHQIYTPSARSKGQLEYMRLAVPNREDKSSNYNTVIAQTELPQDTQSIATILNSAGYTTARFGKWHLGPHTLDFDISSTSDQPDDTAKHYGEINIAEKLTDRSIQFINNHKDDPFFLFLSHFDVHTPIKAKPEVIEYFDNKQKKNNTNYDTTYAAMIHAVDQSVGRIRTELEKLNLDDNTIIIFSSDNGGVPKVTSMEPLRSAKGSLFEGGVRVPTIIHYPNITKPNSTCDTPINSVDFLPTFADIANTSIPSNHTIDGISILPLLNNQSIPDRPIFWHYPLYLSGSAKIRNLPVYSTDKIYWRGVPAAAIRFDDYKLIRYFEDNSTKLYNLKTDISETIDLSSSNPTKHDQLLTLLNNWLAQTNAPIPSKLNPAFDPNAPVDRASKNNNNSRSKRNRKQ